jgi:hypothetical protein
MNYIHPKENGSGRVGHYLIEFGTERGDEAFEAELYAIVGKLPVYDTDPALALQDTPPMYLERALDAEVRRSFPVQFAAMEPEERSAARVIAFLEMMRGVPIVETDYIQDVATRTVTTYPAGSISGRELYEHTYLSASSVPNRSPDQVPADAQRVMAEQPQGAGIHMLIDLV